jgi:uncharacterized protein DUF6262
VAHKRNIDGLKANAQLRHQETMKRTDAGIRRLLQEDRPVNFHTVAEVAGVSTAWLYQEPEVRQRIEHLRERQDNRISTKSKGRTSDSPKNAVMETLRHRIKQLEAENQALTIQVEVLYGQLNKEK